MDGFVPGATEGGEAAEAHSGNGPAFLWLMRFPPYPPKIGGNFTYSARLLEYLADQARVDVLCYDEHDGPVPVANLTWTKLPWSRQPKWRSVISALPNVAEQYRREIYASRMLEMAAEADAVIIDHLAMAWCAELLRADRTRRKSARPAIFFIPHDHHKSVRRQAARNVRNPLMRAVVTLDAAKAARLEARAVNASDCIIVLTERDADQFRVDHPGVRFLIVPPGYNEGVVTERRIDATVAERITVLGGRGSFHKQLVLQQCLDALQREGAPARHVDIVGHIDPGMQAELQARYPGLTFLGYVEDLPAYLGTVRIGLMPDAIGGGFKLRALTFAFSRVPIVAVRGAMDGTGFVPREMYAEADDLPGMVAASRRLVGDFAELNRLQENAFRFCKDAFDWRQRAADLKACAAGLLADCRAPAPGR